jgi:hypothetical protein
MIVDMDLLRKNLPRTYRTVCRDLDLFLPSDELDIDLKDARLSSYTRGELMGFSVVQKAQQPKPVAAPPPPPVPAPVMQTEPPLPPVDFAETMREQEADLKRRADHARAINRLNEYAQQAGLDDTQRNADLIKEFVNNSAAKGYWSYEIIEVAIKALGNQLTWRKVEAPAPSPVAEPTEVL